VDEFGLIGRYFARPVRHSALGVGDDAALIDTSPGFQTAVATDMLVEGVHFFADADPRGVGHKALAVNLSDLAAMGALPRQALLGIALPAVDPDWLSAFSEGFAALAARHDVDWVGGDTARGPLNLCVTVLGSVPRGAALLRSGTRPGDDIWVSGVPGLAALGLAHLRGDCGLAGAACAAALRRLHTPEPRVGLGIALRGIASACIDVSDGLLADLGHVLRASSATMTGLAGSRAPGSVAPGSVAPNHVPPLAAELQADALLGPLRALLADAACALDDDLVRRAVLSGGDDYELLFTAAPGCVDAVRAAAASAATPVLRIGRIQTAGAASATAPVATPVITLIEGDRRSTVAPTGYLHFG